MRPSSYEMGNSIFFPKSNSNSVTSIQGVKTDKIVGGVALFFVWMQMWLGLDCSFLQFEEKSFGMPTILKVFEVFLGVFPSVPWV